MDLAADLERIAAAAAAYSDGTELSGVLATEALPGARVYVCAFGTDDAERAWIALDEAGGLLEITTTGRVVVDPNFDRVAHPNERSETRRQFRVLCKGRPDVKPGDVVTFRPPDEDAAKTAPPLGGGIVGLVTPNDTSPSRARLFNT